MSQYNDTIRVNNIKENSIHQKYKKMVSSTSQKRPWGFGAGKPQQGKNRQQCSSAEGRDGHAALKKVSDIERRKKIGLEFLGNSKRIKVQKKLGIGQDIMGGQMMDVFNHLDDVLLTKKKTPNTKNMIDNLRNKSKGQKIKNQLHFQQQQVALHDKVVRQLEKEKRMKQIQKFEQKVRKATRTKSRRGHLNKQRKDHESTLNPLANTMTTKSKSSTDILKQEVLRKILNRNESPSTSGAEVETSKKFGHVKKNSGGRYHQNNKHQDIERLQTSLPAKKSYGKTRKHYKNKKGKQLHFNLTLKGAKSDGFDFLKKPCSTTKPIKRHRKNKKNRHNRRHTGIKTDRRSGPSLQQKLDSYMIAYERHSASEKKSLIPKSKKPKKKRGQFPPRYAEAGDKLNTQERIVIERELLNPSYEIQQSSSEGFNRLVLQDDRPQTAKPRTIFNALKNNGKKQENEKSMKNQKHVGKSLEIQDSDSSSGQEEPDEEDKQERIEEALQSGEGWLSTLQEKEPELKELVTLISELKNQDGRDNQLKKKFKELCCQTNSELRKLIKKNPSESEPHTLNNNTPTQSQKGNPKKGRPKLDINIDIANANFNSTNNLPDVSIQSIKEKEDEKSQNKKTMETSLKQLKSLASHPFVFGERRGSENFDWLRREFEQNVQELQGILPKSKQNTLKDMQNMMDKNLSNSKLFELREEILEQRIKAYQDSLEERKLSDIEREQLALELIGVIEQEKKKLKQEKNNITRGWLSSIDTVRRIKRDLQFISSAKNDSSQPLRLIWNSHCSPKSRMFSPMVSPSNGSNGVNRALAQHNNSSINYSQKSIISDPSLKQMKENKLKAFKFDKKLSKSKTQNEKKDEHIVEYARVDSISNTINAKGSPFASPAHFVRPSEHSSNLFNYSPTTYKKRSLVKGNVAFRSSEVNCHKDRKSKVDVTPAKMLSQQKKRNEDLEQRSHPNFASNKLMNNKERISVPIDNKNTLEIEDNEVDSQLVTPLPHSEIEHGSEDGYNKHQIRYTGETEDEIQERIQKHQDELHRQRDTVQSQELIKIDLDNEILLQNQGFDSPERDTFKTASLDEDLHPSILNQQDQPAARENPTIFTTMDQDMRENRSIAKRSNGNVVIEDALDSKNNREMFSPVGHLQGEIDIQGMPDIDFDHSNSSSASRDPNKNSQKGETILVNGNYGVGIEDEIDPNSTQKLINGHFSSNIDFEDDEEDDQDENIIHVQDRKLNIPISQLDHLRADQSYHHKKSDDEDIDNEVEEEEEEKFEIDDQERDFYGYIDNGEIMNQKQKGTYGSSIKQQLMHISDEIINVLIDDAIGDIVSILQNTESPNRHQIYSDGVVPAMDLHNHSMDDTHIPEQADQNSQQIGLRNMRIPDLEMQNPSMVLTGHLGQEGVVERNGIRVNFNATKDYISMLTNFILGKILSLFIFF